MAGALAGAAGALSAQTNAIVGLDSLSFALSAEALVMLILGGAGRLTARSIGAAVFTLLHHTAASINPYHWLFVVGGAADARGAGAAAARPGRWLRAAGDWEATRMSRRCWRLAALDKRFGGLHVTRKVSLRCAPATASR